VLPLLKRIEKQKRKIAKIELDLAKEARDQLAGIHSRFGFASLAEFFTAVRNSNKNGAKRRGRPPGKAGKVRRRKRAKITPEMKGRVLAALKAGKTGAEAAAEVGISLPSVQNIKRQGGLVRTLRG
jgi:hypothetical protein